MKKYMNVDLDRIQRIMFGGKGSQPRREMGEKEISLMAKLNYSDPDELGTIYFIAPHADDIVKLRNAKGGFRYLEDLYKIVESEDLTNTLLKMMCEECE